MQAAAKFTLSVGDAATVSRPEIRKNSGSQCALRSALWGLMIRSARAASKELNDQFDGPEHNHDLYALVKNCAFFSGGHCHCSEPPVETTVQVFHHSRQELPGELG